MFLVECTLVNYQITAYLLFNMVTQRVASLCKSLTKNVFFSINLVDAKQLDEPGNKI